MEVWFDTIPFSYRHKRELEGAQWSRQAENNGMDLNVVGW